MRASPRADRPDGAGGSQIRKLENTLLSPRASSLSKCLRKRKKKEEKIRTVGKSKHLSRISGPNINARTTLQKCQKVSFGGKLHLNTAYVAALRCKALCDSSNWTGRDKKICKRSCKGAFFFLQFAAWINKQLQILNRSQSFTFLIEIKQRRVLCLLCFSSTIQK